MLASMLLLLLDLVLLLMMMADGRCAVGRSRVPLFAAMHRNLIDACLFFGHYRQERRRACLRARRRRGEAVPVATSARLVRVHRASQVDCDERESQMHLRESKLDDCVDVLWPRKAPKLAALLCAAVAADALADVAAAAAVAVAESSAPDADDVEPVIGPAFTANADADDMDASDECEAASLAAATVEPAPCWCASPSSDEDCEPAEGAEERFSSEVKVAKHRMEPLNLAAACAVVVAVM